MSTAVAQPRHIFGVKVGVSGNVAFHDEQTIVYPAGAYCVLYNADQKSQKFIASSEKSEGVTAMAVSPNRRYVALAEKGEKPTITIYDLHSLRKRKVLSYTELQANEYVSLVFSPDSKYLVAQAGLPDWVLLYWVWEKSKVLASTRTTNPQSHSSTIHQVTFNPQDNTQLCVVGNGVFKLFRYTEGNLRQFAFQRLDPQNHLCQAWLSDERVIVGTDSGNLLLFDAGELKHEVSLAGGHKTKTSDGDPSFGGEIPQITAIVAYSKGFACVCGLGLVYLFEKTDDKDYFKKTREIKIPPDVNSYDPVKSAKQVITSLAISPSEETLVCATSVNQLYSITLSSAEIGKGDVLHFETLLQSFHSNAITGVDVCIRKPLIATCSLDHSIRIWNFENCTLELYKECAEEAYSIALHPSGLFILVGFSDKLRLMNLLIDDIRTFKEFAIRGCHECAFSNGGHLFAAVNGNNIQLYSVTTFEAVSTLKGHNGKVRSLVWNSDDCRMISCGMEGAVYEWDVSGAKRIGEVVLKICSFTGVAIVADGKTSVAVGSDKTLKEISDSQILRDIDMGDTPMMSVVTSHSGRLLFTGSSSGSLRSLKFPLTLSGEWTEYQGHSSAIVKMKITFDDQFLITISQDSCVMIWKIQDKDGHTMRKEREIGYAEEILITKTDLEEKNTIMAELKIRVEELKTENEYQLRLKDMNYNEKFKELTDKFIQEMESLKTKNQVLRNDKDKSESKHSEEFNEIVEKHNKELQDLESGNNQKLMLEYEKFQDLQSKSQKMQEDYERKLQEMEEDRERALEELQDHYENKLQELKAKLMQSHDEVKTQSNEYSETKKQIEEDADREILDIKIKYEHRLNEEKEANVKLRGETGIMRKKFVSLQKEIDDLKDEIKSKVTEIGKLNNIIKNLEKDITGLKKEIQERDETIQDKEKRIYDLKKKNQELEKFKFVLDYKIKELKKQIEPKKKKVPTATLR